MNSGDISYYIIIALILLFLTRRVLGAVGFRIYWGAFVLIAVLIGYFTLRYCINWSAVSGLADIGAILPIGIAVLIGFCIVASLFLSAGREWLWADRIARWERRWHDSYRHWWHS